MRTAAIGAILFAFAACSTTEPPMVSPYQQPNSLMREEIDNRISQLPYQHREELLENLMWLAQTGEQTIPSLLQGLRNSDPKTRSSCAWVLGRIHDRRTIQDLQRAMVDGEDGVRLEIARSLVLMGDLQQSPTLIAGLDSDRKEVRFMCHEALKTATGHDFGYDHLNQNQQELRTAVLQWRQWWSDYTGDPHFASSYQNEHHLGAQLATPAGETRPQSEQPMPIMLDTPTQVPQDQAQPQQQQNATQPNGGGAAQKPIEVPSAQPNTPPQQEPQVDPAQTPSGYSSGVTTETAGESQTTATGTKPVIVPPAVVPQANPSGRGNGN